MNKLYNLSSMPQKVSQISSSDESFLRKITLYVPSGSVDLYKDAHPWNLCRKVVPLPIYSLNIGSTNWASLYLDFPFEIPAGVQAYVVDEVTNTYVSTEGVEGTIPANTALLINGDPGSYNLEFTNECPSQIENNFLSGVVYDTPCNADENYVLGNSNGTAAFGLYHGTTLLANKAYLPGNYVPSGAQHTLGIGLEVSIENVEIEDLNTIVYNLNGNKISNSPRGLSIVNGQKVYIQ